MKNVAYLVMAGFSQESILNSLGARILVIIILHVLIITWWNCNKLHWGLTENNQCMKMGD